MNDEIPVLHFGYGTIRIIPCEHIETHSPSIMFKLGRPTKIGLAPHDPDELLIPLFVFTFDNMESLDSVIGVFTDLRNRFLLFTTA